MKNSVRGVAFASMHVRKNFFVFLVVSARKVIIQPNLLAL